MITPLERCCIPTRRDHVKESRSEDPNHSMSSIRRVDSAAYSGLLDLCRSYCEYKLASLSWQARECMPVSDLPVDNGRDPRMHGQLYVRRTRTRDVGMNLERW